MREASSGSKEGPGFFCPFGTIACPPPGHIRLVVSVFIASYLLWQLALPLSYYLGTDNSDERFTWRMFSVRSRFQLSCGVSVTEWVVGTDAPVARDVVLARTIHPVWIERLKEKQTAVVNKFLHSRCQADPSVIAVQFNQHCPARDGPPTESGPLRFVCGTGTFRGTREVP